MLSVPLIFFFCINATDRGQTQIQHIATFTPVFFDAKPDAFFSVLPAFHCLYLHETGLKYNAFIKELGFEYEL